MDKYFNNSAILIVDKITTVKHYLNFLYKYNFKKAQIPPKNYSVNINFVRHLLIGLQTSKNINSDAGAIMGIHYDYKSTRGDKAMKKEAKRKARIEQRRAKRSSNVSQSLKEKQMHDINKPITLEDLTNPDKN